MLKKVRLISAAVLLVLANTSYAGLVTYNYTGTTTFGTGIFNGPSTEVSGTITWDDLLLDSNPSGRNDYYANNDPVGNQPYTSSYTATMTFGGTTYSESATNPTILDAFVSLRDHADVDSFRYSMIRNGATEDRFRLAAVDEEDGSVPDAIAAGTNNLTGNMSDTLDIIDNLDLSLFNNNDSASWWVEWDDTTGTRLGRVDFTITSLTRASVPEPGPLALLLLGLAGTLLSSRTSKNKA